MCYSINQVIVSFFSLNNLGKIKKYYLGIYGLNDQIHFSKTAKGGSFFHLYKKNSNKKLE